MDLICPNCGSHEVYEAINFFKCEDCSTIWTDKDDELNEPDFNLSAHREYLAECAYEDAFADLD
jgi:uncharacterized Zn ribbon protein